MDTVIKYAPAVYLGGILGICDVFFTDWEFWVIVVPVIVLVEIRIKYSGK